VTDAMGAEDAPPLAKRLYREAQDFQTIKRAYIPELLIGYISILQATAYFSSRETAVKAMDLANVVADRDGEWIQKALLESGRMKDFVDALALVSRAMVALGENKEKSAKKKRGGKGETLRIWDVNVRN
jgi:nuclear pore complex protein Nup107